MSGPTTPNELTEEMRLAVTVGMDTLPNLRSVLDEYGFAIVTDVLTTDEAEEGVSLFWDYLESLGTGIDRNNTDTQDNTRWPPTFSTGILDNPSLCAGQSRVAWWARLKAKQVFSSLYNTEDLVTSFDTIGIYREKIKTKKEMWYHTDSTPLRHEKDHSTQGILNLIDTTENGEGGLVVLPKSHSLLFQYVIKNADWAPLWNDEPFWEKYNELLSDNPSLHPVRVGAPAGSVILFYSSVVHCNMPYSTKRTTESHLRRAVVYVCMAPRDRVTDKKWNEKRRQAVVDGATTSHWPDRIEKKRPPRYPLKRALHTGRMKEAGIVLDYDDLSDEMKSLL